MTADSIFVRAAEMVGGGIFLQDESNPFLFHLHKHDNMSEMFLVEQGEGEFGIESRTYRAVPGTLLFYQRGVWHEERSTVHPFKGMYIAFRGLLLKDLPVDYVLPPEQPPVIDLNSYTALIADSFKQCIEEYRKEEPESRTVASHLLGILLARLARILHYRSAAAAYAKPSRQAVLTARHHIEENYNQPITLDDLSKITYINPYYLSHLFKEEMGVSPIQYVIQCRVEAAKRYLTISDYTVRRIGELVGYQSETTFQSLFRRMTGVTPGQYRKQADPEA